MQKAVMERLRTAVSWENQYNRNIATVVTKLSLKLSCGSGNIIPGLHKYVQYVKYAQFKST